MDEIALGWALSSPGTIAPNGAPLELLMALLTWAHPGTRAFRTRINKLSRASQLQALDQLNQWRKEAGLKPLKGLGDPIFPVEIRQWAQLRAIQLAEHMAKRGTAKEKREWLSQAIHHPDYLKISERLPLFDECLDRIVGINERKLKSRLDVRALPEHYRGEDLYLDLGPEDLYTPYRIILKILKKLKVAPGTKMVDLGCGMGRLGIVVGLCYPKAEFLGIELMNERYAQAVSASRALKLGAKIQFQCADLSRIAMPEGDVYYLFNPFSPRTLKRVFQGLYALTETRKGKFTVIMAQVGRPPRRVRREAWLKKRYVSPLDRTWRAHGFSIYESK